MRLNLRMTLCSIAAAIVMAAAGWVIYEVHAIREYDRRFEANCGFARLQGKRLDDVIRMLGRPDMPGVSGQSAGDFFIVYKSLHAEYACIAFHDGRVARVSYSWQ